MRKRIIVISEDLVAPWDEGIKKFAYATGGALAATHDVRMINVARGGVSADAQSNGLIRSVPSSRTFMHPKLSREFSEFNPDIVLYVPSPSATLASFARAYALHRHCPSAAVGMVALIPRRHPGALKPVLGGMAPDVVFVPSYASLLHLRDLSLAGEIVPVGVDLNVFQPGAVDEREQLRRKYNVPPDAFVYLHVGHLSPKRNLRLLERLTVEPGAYVIVVGSTSTPSDQELRSHLENAGVRVVREVVPVHEFYRMADAYVFPVVDTEGCVEIPLSVLESLATGLPVLARPFGGLRDVLPAGDDLVYWDTGDELVAAARAMREGAPPTARDMSPFGWETIATGMVDRLQEERHSGE